MPGSIDARSPTVSTTGYADGLGRRVIRFDRELGATLECIQLRPELAVYEQALRDRAAAIAAVDDERFVPVRAIERDGKRVVVTSDLIRGDRLSDIIDARSLGDAAVSGLDAGFGFLLQVLPALARLHAAGLVHGILAPGRVILTASAQVAISDSIYGEVLPRLNLSPRSLWTELQVVAPSSGAAHFTPASDVAQASLCGLMLALGRVIDTDDPVDALPALIAEAAEIAQIRGGDRLADALRRFFTTTLALSGGRTSVTAGQAAREAHAIANGELGQDACVSALREFLRYDPPPAPVPSPVTRKAAVVRTPPPPRVVRTEVRHEDTSDFVPKFEPPRVVERPPVREEPAFVAAVPEPVVDAVPFVAEPVVESVPYVAEPVVEAVAFVPEPVRQPVVEPEREPEPAHIAPVGAREPVIEAPRVVAPEPIVAPVVAAPPPMAPEPIVVPEPVFVPEPVAVREPIHTPEPPIVAAPPAPIAAPVPIVPPVPVAPPVAPTPIVAPLVEEPLIARKSGDVVFQPPAAASIPPPVPPAPPVVFAPPPPVVHTPPPVVYAPPPVVYAPPPPPPPMPVFQQPPTPAVPTRPASVAPNPFAFSPAAAPAPVSAPIGIAAPGPLRLKQEAPSGYAPPRAIPRYEGTMADAPFASRATEREPAGFPKKLAIAVVVIVIAAIAGGRYLMMKDREAAAEVRKEAAAPSKAAPAAQTKTPAPAVSTGILTIESIPTGAKVLLNGTPAGETPLRLEGLPEGRHNLTLTTDSVTVKRTVRVEAGKTVALDIPVFSGWVAIFAPIVLEVSEGSKGLGSTEQGRILLAPGRHVLTVANRSLGYSSSHTVEISAGEETPLNLTPTGHVNLNASPWAEVWVDGNRAGETPIANYEVPLGTREFVFKHPQHGERRITATITATPSAITVDFTKPGLQ